MPERPFPPAFPYSVFWGSEGTEPVDLAELAANEDIYRARFEAIRRLKIWRGVPHVDDPALHAIIAPLELPKRQAEQLVGHLFLVSGWYLEPQHLRLFKSDLDTVRSTLKSLVKSATRLISDIRALPLMAICTLDFVRAVEPAEVVPGHDIDLDELSDVLDHHVRAVERMIEDSARRGGRPTARVRDVALMLAAEALECTTGEPVRISRAGTTKEQPYFADVAGGVLTAFFDMLDPRVNSTLLAKRLEALRRKARLQKPQT